MGFEAVVLAAGLPSRMAPVNKLLTSLGDHPVIRHVVQTTLDAGLDPVIGSSGTIGRPWTGTDGRQSRL